MKQQRPSRLERKQAKFEEWQKQNPSKTFKDYFTQRVMALPGRRLTASADAIWQAHQLPSNRRWDLLR
jgi:hypothetical protein